jgi:hypothetical protein
VVGLFEGLAPSYAATDGRDSGSEHTIFVLEVINGKFLVFFHIGLI